MVSTWSSGSTLPTFTGDAGHLQDIGNSFTFIDFLPECRNPGGFFTKPEYETFRTLVERANDWLSANPKFQLKTCESVEFTAKRDHVNPEKMVYFGSGEYLQRYVRGLRLWLVEKSGNEKSQQIGYFNLIPQLLEKGGIFSSPVYENLDDVVRRFNFMIRNNPLPGRIITVETQEMKTSYMKEDIDPDKSSWTEKSSTLKLFLFVIRIFFELSDGIPEEIGIMDFAPDAISEGGVLTLPKYELFPNAVEKASNWWATQHGIKICNVQSIEIKAKRGQEADTQKMSYTESGNVNTYYLRILRIVYIRNYNHLVKDTSPVLKKITCKTIAPFQTTRSIFVPQFESLQETKNRVSAWIKATGAQVISAETTAMRMYTGGERKHGVDTSFTYNMPERSEYWIFIFRLYINGDYHEPAAEMLPPIPDIENQNCCILL